MPRSKIMNQPFSKLGPFAQRIRAMSEHFGMAPSKLGTKADLSTDTVNKWVREGKPGNNGELRIFAAKHGVSIDWLLANTPLAEPYELARDLGALAQSPTDTQPARFSYRILAAPKLVLTLTDEGESETAGEAMRDLVDEVRKAVFAISCVYGYPLETTLKVAWEVYGATDEELRSRVTPAYWFEQIKEAIFALGKPPSGTHVAVRLPGQKPGKGTP